MEESITTRNVKEFEINVPWGHLSVKTWGSEDNPYVLMFHGFLDNAGSFDNLIPLLPNCYYYICIDLPGHGKSSHFPPYLPIHSSDFMIPFKLVVEYFRKERYIIIGHSFGGQLSFLFSRVYPNYVEKLIMLDALPLYTIESKFAIQYLRQKLSGIFKELSNTEPPAYSYEEALEIFSNNRFDGQKLNRTAAEPLLKRGLIYRGDDKYSFSADQRVKFYMNPLHDIRYQIETLKDDPLTVPVLMIFAKLNDKPLKKYNKTLKYLSELKNIEIMYIDGSHDVHNNRPEWVARHVNKFLLSQKSKM